MVWDDESIKQLIKLWEKGLSTTEIAKKMNVSKNSVVGKVHRLCLKARPSPIKKKNSAPEAVEDIAAQNEVTRATKSDSKKSKSETEKKKPAAEKEKKTTKKSASVEAKVQEIAEDKEKASDKGKTDDNKAENIKLVELDSHSCRWPLGDPRDEDFCFCGKKVRAGQTYCDEHSQIAYVKANTKR